MEGLLLIDEGVLLALGMLFEDLGQGEGPVPLEGHELHRIGIYGFVGDGPVDRGATIDAHGDGPPLAAEIPGELFLGLDEVSEDGIGDGGARYREAREVGVVRP